MRIVIFAIPILLLLLTAIAGYAYSQIRHYSIPISQALALFTVILPFLTGLSTITAQRLLTNKPPSHSLSPTTPRAVSFTLRVLLDLQIIYGTVIATLSLSYIVPSVSTTCGLNEQWMQLFRNRDERAIRTIQQGFECCGYNTVRDRAWPFQSQTVDAGECVRRFGWDRPCAGLWRQTQQINAGLLFLVVIVVFIAKFGTLFAMIKQQSEQSGLWIRALQNDTAPHRRANVRRLIDECDCDDPETGNEHYRDEVPIQNGNGDSQGPRIEPSGLLDENGAQWREDAVQSER